MGGKALSLKTDVTKFGEVKALLDLAVETFGGIDVIINNAGLMPQSPLDRLKIDEWNQMIDVNIKGVLYGIGAVLPYIQKQRSGHIINVPSVAGPKVRGAGAVYAATKFVVRAISEGLREEVKSYNLRTTIIAPGTVDTGLFNKISGADLARGFQEFYKDYAIPADSFARLVSFTIGQPEDVDINELLYRPTRQEF